MKFIHLFFILILIIFQSCTSSSNSQLATLVNDIITEKEAFIEKSIPNMAEFTEELTTNNIDTNIVTLIKNNDFLWNKVEIINDGKSIFINSNDYTLDDSLYTFVYQFIVNYNKKTTFRYHNVNATFFDTTISVKKGDVIEPPYGLDNFYYKVFEQEPSFNITMNINGKAMKPKPQKKRMIPINFLTPSDTDTIFLIVETIACFYHNVESYMYFKENDAIIFDRNNKFCTNDIDNKFLVESKTVSQPYFHKVINNFRKDLNLELSEMGTSHTTISIIKGKEIAIIDISNIKSYSLSDLLQTIEMIEKE